MVAFAELSWRCSMVMLVPSVTVKAEPTALIAASYVATPPLPLFGKPPRAGTLLQLPLRFQDPLVALVQVDMTVAASSARELMPDPSVTSTVSAKAMDLRVFIALYWG